MRYRIGLLTKYFYCFGYLGSFRVKFTVFRISNMQDLHFCHSYLFAPYRCWISVGLSEKSSKLESEFRAASFRITYKYFDLKKEKTNSLCYNLYLSMISDTTHYLYELLLHCIGYLRVFVSHSFTGFLLHLSVGRIDAVGFITIVLSSKNFGFLKFHLVN